MADRFGCQIKVQLIFYLFNGNTAWCQQMSFSQTRACFQDSHFDNSLDRERWSHSFLYTTPDSNNPVNVTPGAARLVVKHYFRDYGNPSVPKVECLRFVINGDAVEQKCGTRSLFLE